MAKAHPHRANNDGILSLKLFSLIMPNDIFQAKDRSEVLIVYKAEFVLLLWIVIELTNKTVLPPKGFF
jgi:hypothetical protein